MLLLMEKIQYSLIYMLYKARYYKSGRGYIYRANQIIAFILSIALSIPYLIITKVKLTSYAMLFFFCLVAITVFYLLERNITKHKLMSNRHIYQSKNRYLILFYSASFFLIFLFVLLNYLRS